MEVAEAAEKSLIAEARRGARRIFSIESSRIIVNYRWIWLKRQGKTLCAPLRASAVKSSPCPPYPPSLTPPSPVNFASIIACYNPGTQKYLARPHGLG